VDGGPCLLQSRCLHSKFGSVVERGPDLEAEERIAHLLVALDHRTVIGQATGVIMERYGLDASTAFQALVRVSSDRQRKVHEIAKELVANGHVEGLGTPTDLDRRRRAAAQVDRSKGLLDRLEGPSAS